MIDIYTTEATDAHYPLAVVVATDSNHHALTADQARDTANLLLQAAEHLDGSYVPEQALKHITLNLGPDAANPDLEMVHDCCGTALCDAEHGDTLGVLASVAHQHISECSAR